jgi:hypothetical protein
LRRILSSSSLALSVIAMVASALPAGSSTLRLSYQEALKREWRHEVLSFRVKVPRLQYTVDTMYVTDETGAVIPAQISDTYPRDDVGEIPLTVSLIADVEPWQTRVWALHYGEKTRPPIPATDLHAAKQGDSCLLSNGLIAVRTGLGSRRFAEAVAADRVPAPVLAVRGRSGEWLGRGWLESPQNVTGYDITLLDDGPIFKRVRARYDFEGGHYLCTVTLREGEEVVHIHEEFDLGERIPARDSNFCFSFYQGLEPDTIRTAGRSRFRANAGGDEAVFPIDYDQAQEQLRVHGLFCWWPGAVHYFGAYRAGDPAGDLLAVFPERPGHWRTPTVLFLNTETTPRGPDLVLRAPIKQSRKNALVDGVVPETTAPGVPPSYGAREWGLLVSRVEDVVAPDDSAAASGIRRARTRYGQNPLDKIKEWALAYPDPGPGAYPRGYITRAELPKLRERARAVPALRARLERDDGFRYLVTGDAELGKRLFNRCLSDLRSAVEKWLDSQGDLGRSTHMHQGIYFLIHLAPRFDIAMSVPEVSDDERREARALFAFLVYKLADPDWLGEAAGFHLGNPNMPTKALSVIGEAASLIPEHPMADEWRLRSAHNFFDMMRDMVTMPGGAWLECLHYQMDAALNGTLQTAECFQNTGFMDLYDDPRLKQTMLFSASTLTPVDPRWGIRTMPPIGHTGYEQNSLYGRMAAGTADTDPEYSRWMQWAWEACGSPFKEHNDELIIAPELPASPPDMSSKHFPGFGSVMRAHFGDPSETYCLFRMGRNIDHYELDQGNIVLYAKGAPLVLDFGSLYDPMMFRPWLHNRVSINHMGERYVTWGEITQTDFLEAADACLGTMTFDQLVYLSEYPGEPEPPETGAGYREISPVIWSRQVLLVKHEQADGPHYVLVRDGFVGDGADFSDFSLWCLANGVDVDGNVAHYTGQHGVDLAVTVLDPATPEFATGSYGHNSTSYLPLEHFKKVNGPEAEFEEIQHFVRLKRTDDKGYFAVLYPHRAGEAPPVFAPWGGGAGVTAAIDGELHTAICAEHPGQFAEGDIALDGQRAVVRRADGRLVLALLSGTRLRAYEHELAASGPAAVTVEDDSVDGEANLPEPGEISLRLPGGITAAEATVTAAGLAHRVALTRDGDAVCLFLPVGKCRFAIAR